MALLDVGLPGLDGYEVARRVRCEEAGRALRLVALTGYGRPEDQRRSEEAGFDAHPGEAGGSGAPGWRDQPLKGRGL